MASPPFNPDATVPGDSDVVSQYPAAERTFRDIIESWLLIEHGRSGHHVIPYGDATDRDAITDWEQYSLFYNTDDSELQIQTAASAPFAWIGTSPEQAAGPIPATTKMVFVQAAAPSGWTGLDDASDRVLSVVTTTSATGGATGGSWTISGLSASVTVGSTTLSTSQIPSHNHSYERAENSAKSGNNNDVFADNNSTSTGNAGGGGSHSHSGSASLSSTGAWRPAYQNVIVCTKN